MVRVTAGPSTTTPPDRPSICVPHPTSTPTSPQLPNEKLLFLPAFATIANSPTTAPTVPRAGRAALASRYSRRSASARSTSAVSPPGTISTRYPR